MTYNPRTYWTQRAIRQGPTYVAYGGNLDRARICTAAFRAAIEEALRDREPVGWVLDFGCGSGQLASTLASYGEKYLGVDISGSGIAQARVTEPDLDFQWLSEDRIPLRDGKISLAVAVTVFQHIVAPEDWALWTGELKRVLGPQAPVLIIEAPYSERAVHDHMKLRTPEEIGFALGRPKLTEFPAAERHFVGLFRP